MLKKLTCIVAVLATVLWSCPTAQANGKRELRKGLDLVFAVDNSFTKVTVAQHSIVYPTGVFPTDVQNVQAAVDLGGTVLLKATNQAGEPTAFNFGPPLPPPNLAGCVRVSTDVNIVGETASSRMTTIQGGSAPIRNTSVPVRTRIQGINFVGPGSTAIVMNRASGIEIVENRISGAVPFPNFFGLTECHGVVIGSSRVTGKVRIANNVIENIVAEFSEGIIVANVGPGAEIEVVENLIRMVGSDGIMVTGSQGPVLIGDNLVIPGLGDPGSTIGNGIFVGGGSAVYRVTRNTVLCENPFADGIIVFGNAEECCGPLFSGATTDPVIEKNRVVMRNSQLSAVALYGLVKGALVKANKIEGDGSYALQVAQGFSADIASSNRFQGNNISHFNSSLADVFFDINTRDNVLVGHCSSLIDLGTNNSSTCGSGNSSKLLEAPLRNDYIPKRDRLQRVMSVGRILDAMIDR